MSNSIGDLKNSGLQGNNWPWQYKVLLGLDKIVSAIGGTEYEAQIIKATCPLPGPPTSGYYLEVRIYNTTTGSFGAPIYYLPGSTTPVNLSTCTKEYANDSLVLTQILTELIDQGVTLDAIETAVEGTLTVQATDLDIRPLTCTDIVSLCFDNAGTPTTVSNTNPLPVNAIVTLPSSLDTTIVSPLGVQADCANAVSTALCQTQEDILSDIKTAVEGTVDVNVVSGTVGVTQSTSPWIVNTTSIVRIPTVLRTTGGSSIPAGARSFSIFNAGSGTASILGGSNNLLAGEEVDFVAGGNDVFGLITFNGNGVTTLVVTYVS